MKTVSNQLDVPFHRADVGDEEALAVADVIRSGWLTMGPKTLEFEEQFAECIGAKHCIAVNSCTAALHLALEALGVSANDEVLVPTNTFTATAEAVAYLGARPILVDIDAKSLNFDAADAERRITSRTKAIIPVHIAGQPCDMDEILDLACRRGLRVVEDAAHSFPALYKAKSIGSISDVTAFSFYATKTLTTGEGGMVSTEDSALASRMRTMRLHGIGRDAWKRYRAEGSWFYEVLDIGFKYNLTDIAAALGLVQLRRSNGMLKQRQSVAQVYSKAFSAVDELEVPTVAPDRQSAWHLYVLRLNLEYLSITRDEFVAALRALGVSTSVHFIPLHLHSVYQQRYGYKGGDFPVAEREYCRYLSLPIFSGMTDEEIQFVIECVLKVVHEHRK